MIRRHKGDSGRFYVNERGNAFAPVGGLQQVEYVFCGAIEVGDGTWFPRDDQIPG